MRSLAGFSPSPYIFGSGRLNQLGETKPIGHYAIPADKVTVLKIVKFIYPNYVFQLEIGVEWMKKLRNERNIMRDALRDLQKELKTLRSSKIRLEREMAEKSVKLEGVQDQVIRLREIISLAMRKEAILIKKVESAKNKIDLVDKKIEKVKSIERDLKDV